MFDKVERTHLAISTTEENITFRGYPIFFQSTRTLLTKYAKLDAVERLYFCKIFVSGEDYIFTLEYQSLDISEHSKYVAKRVKSLWEIKEFICNFNHLQFMEAHVKEYFITPTYIYVMRFTGYWNLLVKQVEYFIDNYDYSKEIIS